MARGEFHKMHGLGNDFVVIDARPASVSMSAARARKIADRRHGIGCDQLIILEKSAIADLAMRIYNSDGSEVESCGNAARCVVAFVEKDVRIETKGGVITGMLAGNSITIDMGVPTFQWDQIPLAFPMDSTAMPLAWDDLKAPMAVNVGNPHAVFFVPDCDSVDLERLGPVIEHDPVFPDRINVNIASVHASEIRLRVWERGVGLTHACGTGACATAVAAICLNKVQSPATVHLPGGTLKISWEPGSAVIMTGEATYVFKGEADWDDFG
jgi:diaminopimelate epimerase